MAVRAAGADSGKSATARSAQDRGGVEQREDQQELNREVRMCVSCAIVPAATGMHGRCRGAAPGARDSEGVGQKPSWRLAQVAEKWRAGPAPPSRHIAAGT